MGQNCRAFQIDVASHTLTIVGRKAIALPEARLPALWFNRIYILICDFADVVNRFASIQICAYQPDCTNILFTFQLISTIYSHIIISRPPPFVTSFKSLLCVLMNNIRLCEQR